MGNCWGAQVKAESSSYSVFASGTSKVDCFTGFDVLLKLRDQLQRVVFPGNWNGVAFGDAES